MPNRTTDALWERQQGESPQAYEAFVIYRDLGAERSIRAVSQKLAKSKTIIDRWSRTNKWVDRCRAYDNHLDEKARQQALKKYKDMNARHIRIALQMQEKALRTMEELPDEALSPKDVMSFLKESLAIEKMRRMEDAGVTTGGGSKSDSDAPGNRSLADEIISAYEARQRR